jgi:hypothetical protein
MTKENELLDIVNEALRIARELSEEVRGSDKNWMLPEIDRAINYFENIKKSIDLGQVPPSHGGGLGITKDLGEWAPEKLRRAGMAIDDFYMKNF